MKKKRTILIICFIILSLLAVGAVGFAAYGNRTEIRLKEQLDLGQKYLAEQDYDKAVVAFQEAIEIEPMNVDAYLGLAEAYIGLEEFDSAIEVLEAGFALTGDEKLKEALEKAQLMLQESDHATVESEANAFEREEEISRDTAIKNKEQVTDADDEMQEVTENAEENHEVTQESQGAENVESGDYEEEDTSAATQTLNQEDTTTGFVITEEEFSYRVMFNIPMDVPASNDEFSLAVASAVRDQMSRLGMVEEYVGPDMIGRCYPIRFGEDAQAAADGIVTDMLCYVEGGDTHYCLHHVKKCDNGYVVTYSIE